METTYKYPTYWSTELKRSTDYKGTTLIVTYTLVTDDSFVFHNCIFSFNLFADKILGKLEELRKNNLPIVIEMLGYEVIDIGNGVAWLSDLYLLDDDDVEVVNLTEKKLYGYLYR